MCMDCKYQNHRGICPIMKGYMEMKDTDRYGALKFSCKEFKPSEDKK